MFKNKLYLYVKLMRLNSPIGILLLLWPPFWVIAYSSGGDIYNFISLIFVIGIITAEQLAVLLTISLIKILTLMF